MRYTEFVDGEIVAHWKNNHAIYARIVSPTRDYINDIYPTKTRIDWLVESPINSGRVVLVKSHALAHLTQTEQEDYILAILEDRDPMVVVK